MKLRIIVQKLQATDRHQEPLNAESIYFTSFWQRLLFYKASWETVCSITSVKTHSREQTIKILLESTEISPFL